MIEWANNINQQIRRMAGVGIMMVFLLVAGCINGEAESDLQPRPTAIQPTSTLSTATSADADPSSTPFLRPTSEIIPTNSPVPDAVNRVVDRAVEDYEVSRAAVELLAYEPMTWSSTALGCPERGRSYAQIVTDGYKVTLSVLGVQVMFNVDESGTAIVECEGPD